jgi:hypothetical protein
MSSAYGIQPQDLTQRLELIELTKITVPAPGPYTNGPDWTVVDAKIAEAEADIHMAASAYYATPVVARDNATTVEAAELKSYIVGKVLDLAMYKLLQLRPHLLNSGDRANYYATVKKTIDTWMQLVSGDSNTRQTLGVARPRDFAITSGAEAWAESETPRVNRTNLGAFI